MMTMCKFPLKPGVIEVALPAKSRVLQVNTVKPNPEEEYAWIWALVVDDNAKPEIRTFRTFATGDPIESFERLAYIGTFLMFGGKRVWRVFEELKQVAQ